MGSILLSQEFQTNAPIFLLLFLMFVVMCAYIAYKIIMERKKRKWEKLFEQILLDDEGEHTMNGQDIIDNALSGASKTASGTGRQQKIAQILGVGFQQLLHQSTGIVQLSRQVAMTQALRHEMGVGGEMVDGLTRAVEVETSTFTAEANQHVHIALGDSTPSQEEPAPQQVQQQLSDTNDSLAPWRDLIRKTAYLAQEVRTHLGGAPLNGEFDLTPALKASLIEKLRQQMRGGQLSEDLQNFLEFLEQQ